jgi:arginyl-tRNA synthetase
MKLSDQLAQRIIKVVSECYDISLDTLRIGAPPNADMGDAAVECFPLAKPLRKSPKLIAEELAEKIVPDDLIESAVAAGPYINITLNPEGYFGYTCRQMFDEPPFRPQAGDDGGDRMMVEYLSPNTNKPLHLGHVRNGALGMAISNLQDAAGRRVVKANLVNDRGVHICKSMLAWQKWGDGATPGSTGKKGDAFVGDWYVRFSAEADKDPSLEDEAQAMLRRWEQGDPEIMDIWRKMNRWVYDGFSETYEKLGLLFDRFYYESETYARGKAIIDQGLEKGVFTRDEAGNVVFPLPEDRFGLDEKGVPKRVTVLRPDGTSLYITQDIGTTVLKVTEEDLAACVFVVGSEQQFHFQCLFAILEALGYAWAPNCRHLSYGMVYLPDGKMKSREGKVVDADDLIENMTELAAGEIRSRDPEGLLDEAEIRERAAGIGAGAVKFYLLRVKPTQDIHFDPKESISFDGFTGPYCQYAYARICGILRKARDRGVDDAAAVHRHLGKGEERLLARQLTRFRETVERAAAEYNPSLVATYLFDTAKLFNQFYNKHSVINAETEALKSDRLSLTAATARVLKRGLELLNIEVLSRM